MSRNFTYTVTNITPDYIAVDFNNGTSAEVPVFKGESREDIEARIADYYFPLDQEQHNTLISEVPFTVGEAHTCSAPFVGPDAVAAQPDQARGTAELLGEVLQPLLQKDDSLVNLIAKLKDSAGVYVEDEQKKDKVKTWAGPSNGLRGEPDSDPNRKYDYKWMRLRAYPVPTEVLAAMWHARNGDHNPQADIDAKYRKVDKLFPPTTEPMTYQEFRDFMKEQQ